MRILICGALGPETTARPRADAMARLGHDVTRLDVDALMPPAPRAAAWLRYRALAGPAVSAVNRAVLRTVREGGPFDLIWCDKPVFLRPETVRRLRETGALVASYNPDNPFGRRNDPGWRLFLKAIPEYSAHVLGQPASMAEYRARGVAHVFNMPAAYEPSIHFPPPARWSEADRDIEVSFVGSPYDGRAAVVRALWRDHGIRVRIWGARWDRVLSVDERRRFRSGGPVYNDGYREVIWRSRISLGFVTRANLDTFARRWFEIAGCGGFLLAERTADGLACFADGEEAVFFDGVEECAAQIARYLPDAGTRHRIARAGHLRAGRSGYDNESRIAAVFGEILSATGRDGAR